MRKRPEASTRTPAPLEGTAARLTPRREAVLRAVHESCGHPTAAEVFEQTRKAIPAISFATVYNALRYLTDRGLVREITFGKGASCYDRETGRHDHAVCSGCGSLVDFNLPEAVALMPKAARQSRFKAQSIHLTLVGLCPRCAEARV
jgi:Fe2+ or Zn2+ uptake regulation protein